MDPLFCFLQLDQQDTSFHPIMAEAHNAVAFQFSVTREGVFLSLNREILKLLAKTFYKSLKRRWSSAKNTFLIGVYPASPATWMFFLLAFLTAKYSEHRPTLNMLYKMEDRFPGKHGFDRSTILAICIFIAVTLVWLSYAYFCQFLLRRLLGRWDVLFYNRGSKVSLKNKIWLGLVKLLSGFNPGLFSFQHCIPKLPVPALNDTLEQHLFSVRSFMDDESYNEIVKLTEDFKKGVGPKFQRYLLLKSLWAPNYVSDWWEQFVYLRSRCPLMINSNYYGVGTLYAPVTNVQSARAANMIYACFRYRKCIEKHRMSPLKVAGIYPLCSSQYLRQFNSTRIPGIEEDRIETASNSYHVAVYHKGLFYKLECYFGGNLLKPADLQIKIMKILENEESLNGEEYLPILTATDRQTWAEARIKYFSDGLNKKYLDIIEQAAFFVVLDNHSDYWDFETSSQDEINSFSKTMLHGKGYDRWFDKSFNLVICKNGQVGFNAEHTWADAPIMAQFWEWIYVEDLEEIQYDKNGNCIGKAMYDWPLPKRLNFEIPNDLKILMKGCVIKAQVEIDDVDLYTKIHTKFGKGDIKLMKVSPDAFIQVAMQLAYYKETKKVCFTYESAMTRLFRDGRTETVRSCTVKSANFVKVADDPNVTDEEKQNLLKEACDYHIDLGRKAMSGQGVDRHLFSLYVVSRYLQIEEPFLQSYINEKWVLSTSQTAVNQTMRLNLNQNPERSCAGGGFGPIDEKGYGVSYIICGENLISFHVSSKKSCPHTSSEIFASRIAESMAQMRSLMIDDDGKLKNY